MRNICTWSHNKFCYLFQRLFKYIYIYIYNFIHGVLDNCHQLISLKTVNNKYKNNNLKSTKINKMKRRYKNIIKWFKDENWFVLVCTYPSAEMFYCRFNSWRLGSTIKKGEECALIITSQNFQEKRNFGFHVCAFEFKLIYK